MKTEHNATILPQHDRMCEHMTTQAHALPHTNTKGPRGDLNLPKDGAQHRRYHAHYDDLLN